VLAFAAEIGGICHRCGGTMAKPCSWIMNPVQGIEDKPANERPLIILIVDDVVIARMVAANQLRQQGFGVIEVSSADEALRILDAPVQVDLVLADVHLEGSSLDGFGLGRWIRANRPATKVLLISGFVPARGPDGETVLPKPIKHEELLRRIRALLTLD
jgi:CheY-like chemotaxis protein